VLDRWILGLAKGEMEKTYLKVDDVDMGWVTTPEKTSFSSRA
jgi:hypothetical protein